jgi:hypothetical protein
MRSWLFPILGFLTVFYACPCYASRKYFPPGFQGCTQDFSMIYAGGRYNRPAFIKDQEKDGRWVAIQNANRWFTDISGMAGGHTRIRWALKRYRDQIQGPVLDIGALYNPVFTDNSEIFEFRKWEQVHIWDKDLKALSDHEGQPGRKLQFIDFNNVTPEYEKAFSDWTNQLLASQPKKSFSAVAVFQVLNYVDFRIPLRLASKHQAKGDFIFISNKINEGDSSFFSEHRPRSAAEVRRYLEQLGYDIIDEEVTPDSAQQKFPQIEPSSGIGERFVFVGKKR